MGEGEPTTVEQREEAVARIDAQIEQLRREFDEKCRVALPMDRTWYGEFDLFGEAARVAAEVGRLTAEAIRLDPDAFGKEGSPWEKP